MTAPLHPVAELRLWLARCRERMVRLRLERVLPWLGVADAILEDDLRSRREALRALDELQIRANPSARTDELYARLREYLRAGMLCGLLAVNIFWVDLDVRRARGRRVARVVTVVR